jgi:hypothetical protein
LSPVAAMMRATAALLCGIALLAGCASPRWEPRVAFAVPKPEGWHYLPTSNLTTAQLTHAELGVAMRQYPTGALIAFSRYLEPYDDVNATFFAYVEPIASFRGLADTRILEAWAPQSCRQLKDLDVVQAPTSTTVAGMPAAYSRIDYTFEAPDGQRVPVTTEHWLVLRGERYVFLSADTRRDERTGTRREMRAIAESVTIGF